MLVNRILRVHGERLRFYPFAARHSRVGGKPVDKEFFLNWIPGQAENDDVSDGPTLQIIEVLGFAGLYVAPVISGAQE